MGRQGANSPEDASPPLRGGASLVSEDGSFPGGPVRDSHPYREVRSPRKQRKGVEKLTSMYERPQLIDRGSFQAKTLQFKRRYGWDQWRRRRRGRCWDDDDDF